MSLPYFLVKKFIRDYKPDETIILGDWLNCTSLSHWNENKKMLMEKRRYLGEIGMANKELDYLQKYSSKITYIEGNHECLDEETDLLTKRGWVKYNEIKLTDKVLSMNTCTGKGFWCDIGKIIIDNFDGELNRINTRTLDLLATNNHKVFHKTNTSYNFTEVNNITKSRYNIPVSCVIDKPMVSIKDDWIKLTAWILTDGHISKQRRIGITQRKQKAKLVTDIIGRLGLKHSIRYINRDIKSICGIKLKNKPQTIASIEILSSSCREVFKYIREDKSIPSWVGDLNKKQFDIFLHSLIDGDGSRHKSSPETSLMLYGKKHFLEEIQKLCLVNGYYASLSTYRECQYRLNINRRSTFKYEKTKPIEKEKYSGKIWDLTVFPYHNFMIRRNGKCHFTGNCWVKQYVERFPQLEGMVELPIRLRLKERGIEWIPYNSLYKKGKVYFTHGKYANQFHAKKHLLKYGCCIVYGHVHNSQTYMWNMKMQEPIMAYGLGCLCDHAPIYLNGDTGNWLNQFAVMEQDHKGNFNIYPINITENQFIWQGRVYR